MIPSYAAIYARVVCPYSWNRLSAFKTDRAAFSRPVRYIFCVSGGHSGAVNVGQLADFCRVHLGQALDELILFQLRFMGLEKQGHARDYTRFEGVLCSVPLP